MKTMNNTNISTYKSNDYFWNRGAKYIKEFEDSKKSIFSNPIYAIYKTYMYEMNGGYEQREENINGGDDP